jgi:hypothetical protein
MWSEVRVHIQETETCIEAARVAGADDVLALAPDSDNVARSVSTGFLLYTLDRYGCVLERWCECNLLV